MLNPPTGSGPSQYGKGQNTAAFERTMSHAGGSPTKSSRLSNGIMSPVKRAEAYRRSLWSGSDFTVCKIIAILAKSRMQIFSNQSSKEHKQQMNVRVIKFVHDFI